MAQYSIDQLIINSPWGEPKSYWAYHRATRMFTRREGRRPAGYLTADPRSKSFDDPGIFRELPLVNQIRPRVKAWREANYPGVTSVTRRLLEHWQDPQERQDRRFFFCQLEAIETLIWLVEAPAEEKAGIVVPGDGGPFRRLCAKMATGSGKTIVMAMLIAWQVLNKAAFPQDPRFSTNIFVVAPGLTVRKRLQVLMPDSKGNYYDEFNVLPPGSADRLRLARIMVGNWHVLNWESAEQIAKKRSVDKRGAKSDEAYVREVLGDMQAARDVLVINDEAHHAWRIPAGSKLKGVSRAELDEATKWIGGLDRIHRARGILACYDFTATPFTPSGKQSTEEALFDWIVSDFGLNDAIESGLVKTPRVVIRDDTVRRDVEYRSRFYHLYRDPEVKDDLNRKAEAHDPLPGLVTTAYHLLGHDWLETVKLWQAEHSPTPPVMITVCNRTETAARVKYALDHGRVRIDELRNPERTLHIDSKVLEKAEAQIEEAELSGDGDGDEEESDTPRRTLTKDEQAERLRTMVDTVGKPGQPGAQIQNVISVGMLSEGWDAKTVTHIMGLRAFSSQLLCEQVVGRGLRRTSYEVDPKTGLFEPEYVNIFGVPFTFLPHEGGDGTAAPAQSHKTLIEPVAEKRQFEIAWPNVLRIDRVFAPVLSLDLESLQVLTINAEEIPMLAEMAPIVDGKPDFRRVTEIALTELGRKYRFQKIAFEAALEVFEQVRPTWKGNREYLLAQIIGLVERFLRSDRLQIHPPLFYQDELRRRIVLTLSMTRVVRHIFDGIRQTNTEQLVPLFDTEHPLRSTGDMGQWYTGRPCEWTRRSHVNFCVYDSKWEASEACVLDRHPGVEAWAKNDHLGFDVVYIYDGVMHKYRPDFLVRLRNGKMLVLEVKGEDSPQEQAKRAYLKEWCQAVNSHGGFGVWECDVALNAGELKDVVEKWAGDEASLAIKPS